MKSKTGIGFQSDDCNFAIVAGSSLLTVINKTTGSTADSIINLNEVLEISLTEKDFVRNTTVVCFSPQINQNRGYSQCNLRQVVEFLADLE
jgi:hypothetical protein